MARDVIDDGWEEAVVGAAWDGEVSIMVRESADGTREAAFVPRGIQRLGEEGLHWMRTLQHTTYELRSLAQRLDAEIQAAREGGLSWDSIGFSLGMTGEGARKRYGDQGDD